MRGIGYRSAAEGISAAGEASDVEELPGMGLKGVVDGHEVLAGNARLFESRGIALPDVDSDLNCVFIAVDGRPAGCFLLDDAIRPEETVHCANAMKAAERAGVTVRMFGDGDTLTLGTATMQVWMLDKPEYTRLNDRSAQIMLTFGQRKMLFSADLEQKGQNGLIEKVGAEMLKADVLKYPHHGLQGLTPEYRAAVSPELAIVTCNQRETEGKKYIRRTALDTVWTVPGFIHLTTDGEMWVCDRIVSDVKY